MTMASTAASPATPTASTTAPRPAAAKEQSRPRSSAALRDQRFRLIQLILFAAGAVCMPLGIVVISLGWYGTAHSHYDYDQRTYLISGGILGLGITFVGGFLYFGAWLAKSAADQREGSRQLTEALNNLADVMKKQSAVARNGSMSAGAATTAITESSLVRAGENDTVHRRDCPLIATRDDLHPVDRLGLGADPHLCRVCRPDV